MPRQLIHRLDVVEEVAVAVVARPAAPLEDMVVLRLLLDRSVVRREVRTMARMTCSAHTAIRMMSQSGRDLQLRDKIAYVSVVLLMANVSNAVKTDGPAADTMMVVASVSHETTDLSAMGLPAGTIVLDVRIRSTSTTEVA